VREHTNIHIALYPERGSGLVPSRDLKLEFRMRGPVCRDRAHCCLSS
jgi:hypothetical protein